MNFLPTLARPTAIDDRFDLRRIGLSDAQLKAIAGARPCAKTCMATSAPVTKGCCWGG